MKTDRSDLLRRLRENKGVEVHEVVLELKRAYEDNDQSGLRELRNTYFIGSIRRHLRSRNPERLIRDVDINLFTYSKVADAFLRDGPSSGACRFMQFDPYSQGPVSQFYKDNTGYDPIASIERARKLGILNPNAVEDAVESV